jgi:hypothetical protein
MVEDTQLWLMMCCSMTYKGWVANFHCILPEKQQTTSTNQDGNDTVIWDKDVASHYQVYT